MKIFDINKSAITNNFGLSFLGSQSSSLKANLNAEKTPLAFPQPISQYSGWEELIEKASKLVLPALPRKGHSQSARSLFTSSIRVAIPGDTRSLRLFQANKLIEKIEGIPPLDRVNIEGVGRYCGYLLNGLPHGFGTLCYQNGDIYQGNFTKGIRSGFGILKEKSGTIYGGNWADDKYHGQGNLTRQLTVLTKECFKGEFVNGKPSFGILKFFEKNDKGPYSRVATYEGHFDSNLILEGKGTIKHSNGTQDIAEFSNGRPIGIYETILPNGNTIISLNKDGSIYTHITSIFLMDKQNSEDILLECLSLFPREITDFYINNKETIQKITLELSPKLIDLFYNIRHSFTPKQRNDLYCLGRSILEKIATSVILNLYESALLPTSSSTCSPSYFSTENIAKDLKRDPEFVSLLSKLDRMRLSLKKEVMTTSRECLKEEYKLVNILSEIAQLIGCKIEEARLNVAMLFFYQNPSQCHLVHKTKPSELPPIPINYEAILKQLRLDKSKREQPTSSLKATKPLPSKSKPSKRQRKTKTKNFLSKKQIRPQLQRIEAKPAPSITSASQIISPKDARKLLSDTFSQTTVRYSLHPRITRWRKDDPRQFADKHPETKEKIQRYQNLSPSEIHEQRARHFLPGLERLISSDLFKNSYTFTTKTGYGMVAKLKIDDKLVPGVVKIGINQGNIHHCFFEPVEINKDILNSSFLETHLEALEADSEFLDEGFISTSAYSFKINEKNQLLLKFTEEDHFLIINPLRNEEILAVLNNFQNK